MADIEMKLSSFLGHQDWILSLEHSTHVSLLHIAMHWSIWTIQKIWTLKIVQTFEYVKHIPFLFLWKFCIEEKITYFQIFVFVEKGFLIIIIVIVMDWPRIGIKMVNALRIDIDVQHHPSFIIHHSSFIIHHSSFIIHMIIIGMITEHYHRDSKDFDHH